MSLPTPKPLSVPTGPSQGPAAARAAAQDAQIAQLVQQVRTLEHTIGKLRAQLDTEKARGVSAVNEIKDQWRAESKEWRNGCDTLQSKHRLAHLGTRVALENERGLRLEDKEALVREKIARLLREHRITLFQARETDLVAQIGTLEDEIEVQRDELVQILHQHETEVAQLNAKLAKSESLRRERAEVLGDFTQEKKALETELTTLRTTAISDAKKVERLTLQVETLRTQTTAVEHRNRELQHQVDKWQSLEGKGEKEVVDLRKRRIELEVRVKELEVSLKENRGIDKKIAKLEASLLETQEQVEQGNQDIAEAHAEAAQAQQQAAKFERKVAKLQAALEAQKARSAEILKEQENIRNLTKPSSSKGRLHIPSVIQEVPETSGDEISQAPAKPSRRQKPASTRSQTAKGKGKIVQHNGSESERESGKRKSKDKERAKESVYRKEEEEDEIVDDEVTIEPEGGKRRSKGKEKAKENIYREEEDGGIVEDEDTMKVQKLPPSVKMNRLPRDEDRDSDIEEIPPPAQKKSEARAVKTRPADEAGPAEKPRSRTGKATSDSADDQEPRAKRRARSKPASKSGGQEGKKQPSSHAEATDAEDEEEQPQRKKKRKLNLTGGSSGIFPGRAGFTWDPDGAGDLGIPSELSPVKDGQPVPARSGASSLLGGWGIWKS